MSIRTNDLSAGPREWLGLALLVLPTLLLSMDVTVLYLALPALAEALAPSPSEMLWIADAYGFLIAGFLVTMGTLGDRIGRRRLLLIGAAAFLVTSALAAYAPSAPSLIVARALLGVAGATLMPSTLALISNMFRDPRQRAAAIGVWAAGLSGGVALGPVVGGVLLEWFWWGAAFLVAVPVMALLLILGPAVLPEYRDASAGRLDLGSVVLSLAAVLPTVYGLKRLAEGGNRTVGLVAIVFGLLAGTAFLRRQRRLPTPLIDLRLFAVRALRGTLVLLIVCLACVAGTYLYATLYLQQVLGLSPLAAGLWILPSALAMALTAMLAPALARRFPAGPLLAASLSVSTLGFLVLTWLDPRSGGWLLAVGMVLIYLGQGPIMALGTNLVVGAAPPERAGAAAALSETSVEFGLAAGIAALGSVGTLVQRTNDLATAVAVIAWISLVCFIALAALAVVTLRGHDEQTPP